MKKRTYLTILVTLIVFLLGASLVVFGFPGQTHDSSLSGMNAIVYKSPTCGCCGNFIGYLERRGVVVQTVNTDNMDSVKNEHKVPKDLESCHTTMVGGYVVEGHIPFEVIEKLLTEKPDIRGIALAGMPSGSPGMPGSKQGPFAIYALNHDGSTSEYLNY